MSDYKRFQKHKSRKYRKLHHLQKSKPFTFVSQDRETDLDQETGKTLEDQVVSEDREVKSKQVKSMRLVSADFKKVLTIFLGFVILLVVFYLIKIKTSFFNIIVDYFFKVFALSQ